MKIRKPFIINIVVIILLIGLSHSECVDSIEQERRQTFEKHASISEQARQSFNDLYNQLSRDSKSPDKIALALELKKSLNLASRINGGLEARVMMPDRYSRLILMWDDSGNSMGYAWEIETPAANNVSWAKYLASNEG